MSIEATIIQYVKEYDALARSLYPAYAKRPMPTVDFFDKGRTNGNAHAGKWEVRFNTLVAETVGEPFRNTVSHEIAHLVEYAVNGKVSHSPTWKGIHRSLGGTGARCSQYETPVPNRRSRVKTEYLYRNENGAECWVGPRHHGKLARGECSWLRNRAGEQFIAIHWTKQTRKIT